MTKNLEVFIWDPGLSPGSGEFSEMSLQHNFPFRMSPRGKRTELMHTWAARDWE